jgi:hypothetical protein
MTITLSHQLKPCDDVLLQEVGAEAVLLSLGKERYFGLDEVGTRIWKLIGEDGHLERVFETLRGEYAVEASVLETDLLALIAEFLDAGLVEIV